MTRLLLIVAGTLCIGLGFVQAQEVTITDFPIGVGGSVKAQFFEPYKVELKAIADTLGKYPMIRAVVTGTSDGERYKNSNDAKNPALAIGRAHALRNILIRKFGVDTKQLMIQSEDFQNKGASYRRATVRIVWTIADLNTRIKAVETRKPVEKHFTEIREVPIVMPELLGMQVGGGLTTSPMGLIPVVNVAVSWKKIFYVEGMLGHTFWNNSYPFEGGKLDTKKRLSGGQVIIYPWKEKPVGIIMGWIRFEQIAQKYYEYVRMSEGPLLGLRSNPTEFLSISASYNPAKQRIVGTNISNSDNGQFIISVTGHISLGGDR